MGEKLYFACKYNKYSEVVSLLERQISQNELQAHVMDPDLDYSSTPLHAAVMGGNHKIVEALLKCGANPSTKDDDDVTPLGLACRLTDMNMAAILLTYGASAFDGIPENYTRSGWHEAVMADNPALVQAMLDLDSSLVNACGPTNWNALHYASQNGKNKVAELLIKQMANIDVPINTGRTALHLAAFQGHTSIS